MKTLRIIKFSVLTLLTGAMLFSCSKDEDLTQQSDFILDQSTNFTVRPDFATVDNRPQEVIAQFKVTDKDAIAVELDRTKTAGKYAVVVGISDYDGTANDLQYCDEDASDWKARLQTEGYTVTSLVDRNATKAAIESALQNLASLSVAGNEIAFVYSGHGSRGNIISTDLYYINEAWFGTTFSNATSTKMMFSFDACQIGEMATALNAAGRIIAVGSAKNTYSYDGDATMQNGVFTYYQMEGFDDLNYIYFEPDCQYACDQMTIWAKSVHVRVKPSYVDSYAGDFDL